MVELGGRIEEAEGEGDPIGRPAVLTNLDPREHPAMRQHTQAGSPTQAHR